MRVAFDTNVLAYAEGLGDAARVTRAVELVASIDPSAVVLPAQTLGELATVLVRKAARSVSDARDAVLGWADSFCVADSTWPAFQSALDLRAREHVSFWDALILSVAAENRCRWLVSEDLHAGLTWRGVTVVDPFSGSLPFE
ncbi:MAG: PIN domain-containing protein [Rhodocyclaceae bacterium]|nr:PIN domain-containing protein [Rhodocyclaceae bacterium]